MTYLYIFPADKRVWRENNAGLTVWISVGLRALKIVVPALGVSIFFDLELYDSEYPINANHNTPRSAAKAAT